MGADQCDNDRRDPATKFVELLTAHQRDLFSYINTLLMGNSAAPDVLQDTNLDLWSRLSSYDFGRPFLPWAYSFAFQRVMAFRKSQFRSRLVFSDEIVALISDVYIESASEADGRLVALRACLDKLDSSQHQLVRDRYVGKLSVNALAARLGSTANH